MFHIAGCRIPKLTLRGLPRLGQLFVHGSRIETVGILEDMPKLLHLRLQDNGIRTLGSLRLPSLVRLELQNNQEVISKD